MLLDSSQIDEITAQFVAEQRTRELKHPLRQRMVPSDDPGEPGRWPPGKRCIDGLSGGGAHELREIIEAYWRARGAVVTCVVEQIPVECRLRRRARDVQVEGLPGQGRQPLQADDARRRRVHPPLSDPRPARRFPPHSTLRPLRQRRARGTHRASASAPQGTGATERAQ